MHPTVPSPLNTHTHTHTHARTHARTHRTVPINPPSPSNASYSTFPYGLLQGAVQHIPTMLVDALVSEALLPRVPLLVLVQRGQHPSVGEVQGVADSCEGLLCHLMGVDGRVLSHEVHECLGQPAERQVHLHMYLRCI